MNTNPGRKKFRPDLSGYYEILTIALVDRLNQDSVQKMSKTDAVKMAIERAVDVRQAGSDKSSTA
jgi:hypothetical protein